MRYTAPTLIVAYALFAILFSWIVAMTLKKRYPNDLWKMTFLFAMLNLSAPLMGIVFTFWLHYRLRKSNPAVSYEHIRHIDMSEFSQIFVSVKRQFGEGAVKRILIEEETNESLKLKAVLALTNTIKKSDIPLLKQTLSSSSDELRLYSFAILDKMEREINDKIHAALIRYEDAKTSQERATLARELASLYWEVIYFDLADEALKQFIAQQVKRYAEEALEAFPRDVQLRYLMGRAALTAHRLDDAQSYFESIVAQKQRTVAYLAEVYFLKRNFAALKKLIREHGEILRNDPLLYPVWVLWSGGKVA